MRSRPLRRDARARRRQGAGDADGFAAPEGEISSVSDGDVVTARMELPTLEGLLSNQSVVRVLQAYLGGAVTLDGYKVTRLATKAEADVAAYVAARWHHDRAGRRIKMFLFLHDIDCALVRRRPTNPPSPVVMRSASAHPAASAQATRRASPPARTTCSTIGRRSSAHALHRQLRRGRVQRHARLRQAGRRVHFRHAHRPQGHAEGRTAQARPRPPADRAPSSPRPPWQPAAHRARAAWPPAERPPFWCRSTVIHGGAQHSQAPRWAMGLPIPCPSGDQFRLHRHLEPEPKASCRARVVSVGQAWACTTCGAHPRRTMKPHGTYCRLRVSPMRAD